MEREPSGSCGICKTALLNDKLVVCQSCRALYHDACWTYNGGRCAVYGCPRAHAERDPLPSLSAVPWTGVDEPPPSPPIPEPEPEPEPKSEPEPEPEFEPDAPGDNSLIHWFLVILVIAITALMVLPIL